MKSKSEVVPEKPQKKTTTVNTYREDAAFLKDVAHYESKNVADVVAEAVRLLRSKKKGVPMRTFKGV